MEGILLHVLYRGEKAADFAAEMERSGLRATTSSTAPIVTVISSSESTKPVGLSISRIIQVPYGTLAKEKLPSSFDVVAAIAFSFVNSVVPVLKIPITAPPRAFPSSSDFLPLTEP